MRVLKTKKEFKEKTDSIKEDLSIVIKHRDITALNCNLMQEEINSCFMTEISEEESAEKIVVKKGALKSKKTKIIKKDTVSSSHSSDSKTLTQDANKQLNADRLAIVD